MHFHYYVFLRIINLCTKFQARQKHSSIQCQTVSDAAFFGEVNDK